MNQERVIAASYSDAQSGADGAAEPESETEMDASANAQTDASMNEPSAAQTSAVSGPGTMRLMPRQPEGNAASEPPLVALTAGDASASIEHTMLFDPLGGAGLSSDITTTGPVETGTLPFLEDGAGRRFVLRPGVNTIGRDHTDITIADRSVSRYHGMIVYDEERDLYSVEDSGSMNGSRVNGERLLSHRPRAIHPGDQVTFGDIILRFVDAANASLSPKQTEARIATPEELAEAAHEIQAAPTPLLEDFLWLKLLRGDAPEEILVGQGVTTIGRLPDNLICLPDDRYISGHHAKIEAKGKLFLLLDVGSTNGTYLNGLRLTTNTAVAMNDCDEVLLGGLLFQVYKPSMDADPETNSVASAFADYEGDAVSVSGPPEQQQQPE